MLEAIQKKLIFRPKKLELDQPFDLDLPHEEIFLEDTELGLRIHALWVKSPKPSKGLILYYHGNSDNLLRWSQYVQDFTDRCYDILLIDYPGFGKSSGFPTEESVYQAAELSYKWAQEALPYEIPIIYGRSIGTAPASYLASRFPTQQLILETPFYSLKDLFERHPLYKFLDPIYHLPVYEYVANVQQPVTIFQGTKDKVVPLESASRLKEVLKPTDQFYVIPGGKHKDLSNFDLYQQKLSYILG